MGSLTDSPGVSHDISAAALRLGERIITSRASLPSSPRLFPALRKHSTVPAKIRTLLGGDGRYDHELRGDQS